jgi:hypothetical protein
MICSGFVPTAVVTSILKIYYSIHESQARSKNTQMFKRKTLIIRSRDSSVGIATGYVLGGWCATPSRCKTFLFSTAFRPALGPHSASYQMGT